MLQIIKPELKEVNTLNKLIDFPRGSRFTIYFVLKNDPKTPVVTDTIKVALKAKICSEGKLNIYTQDMLASNIYFYSQKDGKIVCYDTSIHFVQMQNC